MARDAVTAVLLDTGAYKEGKFTLASGQESNFYIDCRIALLQSKPLRDICDEVLRTLRSRTWRVGGTREIIGGTGLGGSLLVAGCLARPESSNVAGVHVRDAAKDHGSKKLIEGHVVAGESVILLEDVITTGGSIIRALDALRGAGCTVPAVICLVDRSEGRLEHIFSNADCQLISLTTPAILRKAQAARLLQYAATP